MLCFKTYMKSETLAEYVTRVMREENLSGYQIEERSRPKITQSYVNRIKNGTDTNPSLPKLEGLATGMGRPFTEVLAAARGEEPHTDEITHERLASINFAYEGMPKKKRAKAEPLIEMLEREIRRIESEPE